jgi:hypothetical protein
MCKDFTQNFGDCFLLPTLLSPDFVPSHFSLFFQLKDCHVDTNEVIEVELQAVPNILREHNFQDAFKKWQKHWEY